MSLVARPALLCNCPPELRTCETLLTLQDLPCATFLLSLDRINRQTKKNESTVCVGNGLLVKSALCGLGVLGTLPKSSYVHVCHH